MVTKDDREKNYRLFLCKILRKGGEAMDFDYFYNREAERFNFLKVPEILVDGEEFKGLSAEAIILYSMLLKRTGMSFKNNWIDKDGRVFIYFTVEEIMRRRNISKPTASSPKSWKVSAPRNPTWACTTSHPSAPLCLRWRC